ncbi:MAG: hypothetical protein KDJ35_01995 [Alphaproteobacteria bacterium]|nr:hypothetical protein [Alphaproteobacteria bacterium]
MAEKDALTDRLNALIQYIEDATHTLNGGQIPLVNDLDQKVAKLCMDVEQGSTETAKEIKPLMGKMIIKLDELAARLQEMKDKTPKGT